jgi:ubiquinone/menaquinone biosynthesis C-methylase UbiE
MRKTNTTLTRRLLTLIPAAGLLLAFAVLGPESDPLHAQTVEAREQSTNERQPPDRIMDAIGLKLGMVIGEVGAGRGRFTVHLAVRVGPTGRVYANDINADGLAAIRDRCLRDKLGNVETILGRVDDPLFPKASLDLVFMVLTYHHLARPVDLLKNLIPSLKPGATVVVIDPDPVKEPGEIASEYTPREKIEREAGAAGFEIVRTETFLSRDNLFILQVKGKNKPASGEASVVLAENGWKMVNRGATAIVDGFRKAVRFDERPGNGIAWLEGSKFTEGTIEFDVRGKDVPQRSFVGIVFNGTDDETWDAVYFRPFNFKNPDPVNAGRGDRRHGA